MNYSHTYRCFFNVFLKLCVFCFVFFYRSLFLPTRWRETTLVAIMHATEVYCERCYQ